MKHGFLLRNVALSVGWGLLSSCGGSGEPDQQLASKIAADLERDVTCVEDVLVRQDETVQDELDDMTNKRGDAKWYSREALEAMGAILRCPSA
jgi:hypothetical protein